MAGIEIIEARINYLAYAPEDSSRNVASPTGLCHNLCPRKNSGRSGFYGRHGTEKLDKENVVALDDDKKAAMVSNLMVVLCSENATQPVVNSGTLNM